MITAGERLFNGTSKLISSHFVNSYWCTLLLFMLTNYAFKKMMGTELVVFRKW